MRRAPVQTDERARHGPNDRQKQQAAGEALKVGDLNQAAQIYGMVLQQKPEHPGDIIGMEKVLLAAADHEQAKDVLDTMLEAERKGEEYA